MKITILGANSYIARNLIYKLLQKNGLQDCNSSEPELFLYDYNEIHFDGVSNYKKINILERASLEQIKLDVDIIYIFIGKTGTTQGFEEFNDYIDINEKALLNILNIYRTKNSKAKLIFPSTRLVYKGVSGKLQEDAPKEFKTIYSINKYACEQYINMYHNIFDIQYCIFRICVPYGTMIKDASSYGTAEFMLKKAHSGEDIVLYGDGRVRRTVIHMDDLCNILIYGALEKRCTNNVFNIGGEDYSLVEMAEKISNKYKVGVKFVDWPETVLKIESGDTVFNSKKLDQILDYKLQHSFEQWIKSSTC